MTLAPSVLRLIDLALDEDLGRGDPTSEAIFDERAIARGAIVAKSELVLSGLDVARAVFARVDPETRFERLVADGARVAPMTPVGRIEGRARSVLAAERTALNFLQRASGIATATAECVAAVAGTNARIVDTRKTAPGFRALDKAAVRDGGGTNHRADLASGVLIKDNHVAACGSVRAAVERAQRHAPHTLRVEVEVSSAAQLDEALAAGAELVLIDNLPPDETGKLVARVAGRALVEVSGGITLATARAYAEAGVDLISIGALTHSVRAADLSLEIE